MMTTTNTVVFPAVAAVSIASDPAESQHNALTHSHHSAALEICDLVYGSTPSSWETIERFYESSAIYENPFLTATSRAVISDIHTLSSQLARLDIPKPISVIFALFGIERTGRWADPWFRAIRVWSEVGDVCESDSFDGHRKTIIEHTLHILLLPGLHSAATQPPTSPNLDRTLTSASDISFSHYPLTPEMHTTLGLDLSIPSPLHLRLPIMTRLSFNDVSKITHHRDFWDVKDLLGLVPGMTLAQWISGRIFAQGIRGAVNVSRSLFGASSSGKAIPGQTRDDEEELTPAEAYAKAVKVGMYRARRASCSRGCLPVPP